MQRYHDLGVTGEVDGHRHHDGGMIPKNGGCMRV